MLITLWVLVDQWARKNLGERNRCCHSFDKDTAGCCGKHKDGDTPDGRPTPMPLQRPLTAPA